MNMSPERKKATDVLAQYWAGRSTPVDPFEIAKEMGLEVKSLDPFDDAEGNLSGAYEDGSVGTIYYNPIEPPRRRRFTVAHELGHHVLGHGANFRDPLAPARGESYNPVEVAANRFAAELLMPAYAVKTLIDHAGITSVSTLAEAFEVSEPAMLFRLKNLGYVR